MTKCIVKERQAKDNEKRRWKKMREKGSDTLSHNIVGSENKSTNIVARLVQQNIDKHDTMMYLTSMKITLAASPSYLGTAKYSSVSNAANVEVGLGINLYYC